MPALPIKQVLPNAGMAAPPRLLQLLLLASPILLIHVVLPLLDVWVAGQRHTAVKVGRRGEVGELGSAGGRHSPACAACRPASCKHTCKNTSLHQPHTHPTPRAPHHQAAYTPPSRLSARIIPSLFVLLQLSASLLACYAASQLFGSHPSAVAASAAATMKAASAAGAAAAVGTAAGRLLL